MPDLAILAGLKVCEVDKESGHEWDMKILERLGAAASNDLLKGHIDSISRAGARGWAFEQGKTAPLLIRVSLGGTLLAEGTADAPRPDVEKALGVFGCGFHLSSELLSNVPQDKIDDIIVEAVSADGRRRGLPKGRYARQKTARPVGYQSFVGQPGASDSAGKLRAIQLPNLSGKSFLDLGCNAGFFCGHALEFGRQPSCRHRSQRRICCTSAAEISRSDHFESIVG